MDEMADHVVTPDRCPRCGKKVVYREDGSIFCEDCGELYYDQWLGIWRIKPKYDE